MRVIYVTDYYRDIESVILTHHEIRDLFHHTEEHPDRNYFVFPYV